MNTFYTNVEKRGNTIFWRGYENGIPFKRKEQYRPTLFFPAKNPTSYTSLYDKNIFLRPNTFDSMSEADAKIEQYKDMDIPFVYGSNNFISAFIQEKFPDKINFDPNKINTLFFDIEVDISDGFSDVEVAQNSITSISLKSSKSSTYRLLVLRDYDPTKTITKIPVDDIKCQKFDTEEALLRRFIQLWTYSYPDVVSGWNIEFFDVVYIINRIIRVLGEEKAKLLSPWGHIRRKTTRTKYGEQSSYHIMGITQLDYLPIFKKFAYKYNPLENYKLDHVAHVVLGSKKLSYEAYGSLTELYNQNPQLYIDYNLNDTWLVQEIDNAVKLIGLIFTFAYNSGVNYLDTLGTVGIWETILYRNLMNQNIVSPIKSVSGRFKEDFGGGHVKKPKPGMKNWIVSFDLNSLYPHLMMQYNMSPETYVRDRKEFLSVDSVLNGEYQNSDTSVSVCPNGAVFTNEKKGFISSIIEEYYENRTKIKTQMIEVEKLIELETDEIKQRELKEQEARLHNEQMRIKIALNSLYGATANIYFQYYIHEMAEAITTSGQLSIRWAEKTVNEYLNKLLDTKNIDYVEYVDTDSIYVNLESLMNKMFKDKKLSREKAEKFLEKFCKTKLIPVINKGYDNLAHCMGSYKNAMSMKLEKISDKTIFIAKKRYIVNSWNTEGVHHEKPKIGITGVEAIRSSTPEICRDKMEEAFWIILNKTEKDLQKFIQEFRDEFSNMRAEEIAKISGVDNIEKYLNRSGIPNLYKKGVPYHVRGSIVFNNFLEQKGLTNKYECIKSGDKVKIIYLKLPNPVRENLISFETVLPDEFDLSKYIDYETQFLKVFLQPLEIVTNAIQWNTEETFTLEDLWG